MYINWTPLRALVNGTGSDGKLEIGISQEDRRSSKDIKEARALSGLTETILHRIDYETSIKSIPTDDTSIKNKFRELDASVAAGEVFTVDLYGTELEPIDPISVQMVSNTYNETRKGIRHFEFSFRIREV